jgi:hypothetical protein
MQKYNKPSGAGAGQATTTSQKSFQPYAAWYLVCAIYEKLFDSSHLHI